MNLRFRSMLFEIVVVALAILISILVLIMGFVGTYSDYEICKTYFPNVTAWKCLISKKMVLPSKPL